MLWFILVKRREDQSYVSILDYANNSLEPFEYKYVCIEYIEHCYVSIELFQQYTLSYYFFIIAVMMKTVHKWDYLCKT